MKLEQMISMAMVAALGLLPAITNAGDTEIYLSFSNFGDGAASSNTMAEIEMGMSGSAFVWVDENFSIDTGAFLDVLNDNAGVLEFTGATVFNPDIAVMGIPSDVRWQSVGDQGMSADFIDELNGFSVNEGTGILSNQTTGNLFEDTLHDPSSGAFLFAQIDFDVVGVGAANLSLESGDGFVVNNNVQLSPNFGGVTVNGIAIPEPASASIIAIGLIGLVSRRRR